MIEQLEIDRNKIKKELREILAKTNTTQRHLSILVDVSERTMNDWLSPLKNAIPNGAQMDAIREWAAIDPTLSGAAREAT